MSLFPEQETEVVRNLLGADQVMLISYNLTKTEAPDEVFADTFGPMYIEGSGTGYTPPPDPEPTYPTPPETPYDPGPDPAPPYDPGPTPDPYDPDAPGTDPEDPGDEEDSGPGYGEW